MRSTPRLAALRGALRGALCALLLVLLVLAALALAALRGPAAGAAVGGAARARPRADLAPHLVVDTLNLTHWLTARKGRPPPLTPAAIVATIDATAATLRARHPGRVMYVVKDRETALNSAETQALYRAAAERNGVYVYAVEQYADPPAAGRERERARRAGAEHSSRGRDDFYMALLARRWRCAVLTEDRFRDFARFRATVPPFHVREFAYWRAAPARDFVDPAAAAHARVPPPPAARYDLYFPRN